MSNSTSIPPRIPESDFTKTDTLATQEVGFGHSIYGWNQNFIELPMALVRPQIPFESMGIVDTSGRPESFRVLCHRLLGRWPVYCVAAR
jgi:hypothetical protein